MKPLSYFVYVLRSLKDGKLYTGMTGNIRQRLRQHAAGKVKSTFHRRPLLLVHLEEFPTRLAAERRERFLKTGHGRSSLKNLLRDIP